MGEYWNTALTARVVLDTCEDHGIDTDAILDSAEIDRSTVSDPDGRLTLEQMRSFWGAVV